MNSGLSQVAESNITAKPARLYYIDWLRMLAMFSIFFYHCNRFFTLAGWHVKNNVTSLGSTVFMQLFNQWMMPLFFVISGAAVYYSLKSRKTRGFIKERTLRILIPLVSIGIFVLAPPQVYLERLTHGEFSGSFFQFYPHYFDGLYGLGGNFAWMGVHLWYLMDLFIFSLIALPLFLPLAAVWVLADVAGLGFTRQMSGWDILSYLLFFIYGYLVFSNTRIQETIRKYSTVALIATVVLAIYGLVMEFVVKMPVLFGTPYYMSVVLVRALRAWCWLIAILGFGSRFLNFNNRFLGYANEAVLPFYIWRNCKKV